MSEQTAEELFEQEDPFRRMARKECVGVRTIAIEDTATINVDGKPRQVRLDLVEDGTVRWTYA